MVPTRILVGCDPELFVYSKNKKRVVSAHNLLPGTKANPYQVPCGAIQVDGVAAEFNIQPADTAARFQQNIAIVKNALRETLDIKSRLHNDTYSLLAKPCVFFTKTYWETVPEEAKELGCEPDFDAYTLKANEKPNAKMLMRTGSGHIHISWGDNVSVINDNWIDNCAGLVQHFDHHLYPQSLKWDSDKLRRKLYGKIGAFRPKKYGVEYRVLSNAWVDDYRVGAYIFNSAEFITRKWLAGFDRHEYEIPEYVA